MIPGYLPAMAYRITGLDPTDFAHLVALPDDQLAEQGAVRMTADAHPGFPCRITLDDVQPGDAVLLVNHCSHECDSPYRATHAIFVSEAARSPATYRNQIPPALDRRILSLRGFDAAGMMRDAVLVQPGEADPAVRTLFADLAVDHIDAHNATRGCFAARIERDEEGRVAERVEQGGALPDHLTSRI